MLHPSDDISQEAEDISKTSTVPDLDNEYIRAKTFLQTGSTATGENLYDHLTEVLNKILAERPENVIDFFEEYSRKVKEKRFRPLTDHLEDIFVHPSRYKQCKKQQLLLLPLAPDEPSTMDPEDMQIAEMTKNNMLQLLYYFEQAGVGLPRVEMFALMMSMIHFIKKEPVSSVRFWGKVFGDGKNYLVLEAELKDDEILRLSEAQVAPEIEGKGEENVGSDEEESKVEENEGEDAENVHKRHLPPLPKPIFEKPPVIPPEPLGVGVNMKVYYVCSEVGDDWVMLPKLTPQHIQVARLIRKTLTGDLNQQLSTYPEFPGTEAHYLHAQIVRITASTHISPLGYYTFGEEAGEDVEDVVEEDENKAKGEMKTNFTESRHFEGMPLSDLLDPSMAFWVHHAMYILPQGRTTWWSPDGANEEIKDEEIGEEEEEEDEEKVPDKNRAEPETGPPLLTPLSEDSSLETISAWTVRASSALAPNFAIAIVRSNIWPGAFCFATQGKLFANVYLGDGLKYVAHNFSPKPLPPIQQEYPAGPEIMEMSDPSGADEEDWRIAHLPPEKTAKEEEALEEEEIEEEEEEED